MQRGNGHCYMESSFSLLEPVYKPPAVASGAAQGRGHTTQRRGTRRRGDIQAVTGCINQPARAGWNLP